MQESPMQSKAQTSIRSKPTLFLFCMLSLVFVVSLVVDTGALLVYLFPELFPELTFWAPAEPGNSSGTVGAFNYVLFIFIIFGFFYPSGFGLVFLLIFIASVIMTWNWFRQVSESIRALDAGAVGFQGRAAGNDNAVDRSCLMKLTHALGDIWSKTLPDGAALEDGARAPRVVRALPLILALALPSLLGNLYSWLASWVNFALPMVTDLVRPYGFASLIDIWFNSPLLQISVGLLVVSDVALVLACVYMISFIKRVTANLETRLSDQRKAARETNG